MDDLAIVLALAAALALYLVEERRIADTAGFASFPLDDSWIHLHFARNLAEGAGFAYNPGVPVAGSTAPLWTLALAAAFALGGAAPEWAKVLGVAAALGSALLARRLAWVWTERRGLALAAGLATAVAGPLVWGALSGMEVALAALLATGAVLAHARGRAGAAALLAGLAVLARPEALLLVGLLWLAGPLTARRTAVFAVVVGALLAPWVAFNLATAGTPLPSTASAKVSAGLIGVLSGAPDRLADALLWRPWQFEEEWVRWLWSIDGALPPLAAVGLVGLWRARGRAAALPASILLLHPIGMAVLAPHQGPAFQEGRYSIHLLPLAVVVAVAGAAALARLVPGRERLARAAFAALIVVGAIVTLPAGAARYAWAVKNIDAMQVHLGRWLAAHTPPNAQLALNDVGAIAYFSRRHVVDVMGLVTPAIIPYRRRGEAGVLEYLEQVCPDYLVIFPAWFPELSSMRDRFTPIYKVRLAHNTVAGADEMVVYETPWRGPDKSAACPGRAEHPTSSRPG